MKINKIYLCTAIASLFAITSCTEDDDVNKAGTFYGQPVSIGAGSVKSFVKTNQEGLPTALGIAFSKEGLTQLPAGDSTQFFFEYTIPLPNELNETAFKHITVDWNPMGHEPDGIYTSPHFDFHFYMISEAERMQIGPEDPKIDVTPEARFLPTDYFTTPGGVPAMGKHWIDKFAPELAGQPFTATFLYGSYDGEVTFLEPMITLDYMLSKPEKHLEIKQPVSYEREGYYPNQYAITYDAASEQYLVTLENLEKRMVATSYVENAKLLLASASQAEVLEAQFNIPICKKKRTK